MKEYDVVKVIVEKEKYARQNVHKGMSGTIIDPRSIDGTRLVCFDGDFKQLPDGAWYTTDIECAIKEEDLELVE